MRVFLLWRYLNKTWTLMDMSADRAVLSDLLTEDSKRWTLPVDYRLETRVVKNTDNKFTEGRIQAFREAAVFLDHEADKFTVGTTAQIGLRRASCKMFGLMEKECSK